MFGYGCGTSVASAYLIAFTAINSADARENFFKVTFEAGDCSGDSLSTTTIVSIDDMT